MSRMRVRLGRFLMSLARRLYKGPLPSDKFAPEARRCPYCAKVWDTLDLGFMAALDGGGPDHYIQAVAEWYVFVALSGRSENVEGVMHPIVNALRKQGINAQTQTVPMASMGKAADRAH